MPASDQLAAEEPLEIRVGYQYNRHGQRTHRTLSVTMRTPGNDEELAAGFLLTEGIIQRKGRPARHHSLPRRAKGRRSRQRGPRRAGRPR